MGRPGWSGRGLGPNSSPASVRSPRLGLRRLLGALRTLGALPPATWHPPGTWNLAPHFPGWLRRHGFPGQAWRSAQELARARGGWLAPSSHGPDRARRTHYRSVGTPAADRHRRFGQPPRVRLDVLGHTRPVRRPDPAPGLARSRPARPTPARMPTRRQPPRTPWGTGTRQHHALDGPARTAAGHPASHARLGPRGSGLPTPVQSLPRVRARLQLRPVRLRLAPGRRRPSHLHSRRPRRDRGIDDEPTRRALLERGPQRAGRRRRGRREHHGHAPVHALVRPSCWACRPAALPPAASTRRRRFDA